MFSETQIMWNNTERANFSAKMLAGINKTITIHVRGTGQRNKKMMCFA